ncbi:MAG: hypothetical protein Kow0063_27440 [Anaerolineae bacterium]
MKISNAKRTAMQFVVLLGIVRLLGDMTYEGARSITGPYLGLLEASAAVVASVAGFGELIGLSLRLFFGWLSDRTGRYWATTLTGCAVGGGRPPAGWISRGGRSSLQYVGPRLPQTDSPADKT